MCRHNICVLIYFEMHVHRFTSWSVCVNVVHLALLCIFWFVNAIYRTN